MKTISLLKNILKNEAGAALPAALALLLVGGLMVVPAAVLTQTSLTAHRTTGDVVRSIYTSDAGIEYTLWEIGNNAELQNNLGQLTVGEYVSLTFPEENLNGKNMTLTLANQGDSVFRMTSTTSGGERNVAILSDVRLAFSAGTYLSPDAFDYALASLNGDINLSGNTETESDEVQQGDVYANGNVTLTGNAEVNGDAAATGTITVGANAEITGTELPGAAPLSIPIIDPSTYENETLSYDWGTVTHPTGWSIPGIGAYTYTDTVHIAGGDLNISRIGTITLGAVCVDAPYNIVIGSMSTVIFNGPVKVGGSISIASNNSVTFDNTVYVGGNFTTSGNAVLNLGGTVYIKGSISMSGNSAAFNGGHMVIAEGPITLTGNSQLAAEEIPFIMTTYTPTPPANAITLAGNNWTSAILYAPNGPVSLSGNSRLYGSAVGKSIAGSGNSRITYPIDLRNRTLPGGTTSDPVFEGISEILTYTIETPQQLQ
jgi:hypothetical protein